MRFTLPSFHFDDNPLCKTKIKNQRKLFWIIITDNDASDEEQNNPTKTPRVKRESSQFKVALINYRLK